MGIELIIKGLRLKSVCCSGLAPKILTVLLVCIVVFLSGCASTRSGEKDADFADLWFEQSASARGYSPEARARDILEVGETLLDFDEIADPVPDRPLPEERITLRLNDAPVQAVLRAMARTVDQNMIISDTIGGDMSLDIRDIPWNQAFMSVVDSRGLAWSWDGEIIRVRSIDDIRNEIILAEMIDALNLQRAGSGRSGPLLNRIIRINYANAEKLKETLEEFLGRDMAGTVVGRIAVNEETNSIVIQAPRDDMNRISRMVEHLDRPRAQILIEANIVEATQETARELGMRWSGRHVTSTGSLERVGVVGEPRVPAESFLGEGGMALGLVAERVAGSVLYANLQALQRDGKVKILSSPSITTMDNQMAYTEHGEKVPYETSDEFGAREVEFEDAVLRLEVTPSIIDGEHMRMTINVKKDEVDFTQTVNGNPLIKRKETATNLVVRNGETIVISGLSKQSRTGVDEGVPFFKGIPIFGWLFKKVEKSDEMEEFLIFITPTILGKRGA